MKVMKLYFTYLKHQFLITKQYRSTFFLNFFTSILYSVGMLFGIVLLFQNFTNVAGYSLQEVLITYSVVLFVFSISEWLFRGLDLFDTIILNGELDRMLLRPRGMMLQILGHKMEFVKLGRASFSFIILIYACITSSIVWDPLKVITLILMVISGTVIFLGVFLLAASFTIYSIQGMEVVNIFTNGGRELSSYPLDIYKKALTNFFTFVVPFACFNYLPLQYLLGNPSASVWVNMLAPVYGMVFVIPCYFVFRYSLTKYNSTGT